MLNKDLLMVGGGKPLMTFYRVSYGDCMETFHAEEGMTWFEFANSNYNEPYDFWFDRYRKVKCTSPSEIVVTAWYDLKVGSYMRDYDMVTANADTHTIYVRGSEKIIDGHTYGWCLCYAAGTLITLYDGTTKKIEDITYDDDLLVWDFDNGCFATAKPSWITKAQRYSYYYKITLDDGTQLDLIGSDGDCHRLFNVEQSKFVYGSRFNIGERTFKQDKSTPKVVSIELVHEEVVYYNLITKGHLNCFINGVLSSCRYNNLYPIEDMKFVKSDRGLVPHNVYSRVPLKYYNDLRLGEVDTSEFPIEETRAYVDRLIKLRA